INTSCPAQIKERIKHFASKGAFDIDGLGDKLVDQLVSEGLLFSYADIFHLDFEQLHILERMGKKSADNLLNAIEQSQRITFGRFIYALGIRHVGEHVAGILADSYKGIESLYTAAAAELEAIDGIGPVVAESIVSFFEQTENRIAVNQIIAGGLEIIYEAPGKDSRFEGKIFGLTGTLKSMTRGEAKRIIDDAGGKVAGSISKNTDYLVVGDKPGSKYNQAQRLGTVIIDEETFKEMIGR
ncbi:helix-hairpin-helix domain-containing protein, partial [Thermodesulfobacteriota bacterium]